MEQLTSAEGQLSPEVQALKEHMDSSGIRYSHVTDELGVDRSWLTHVFKGNIQLTPDRKSQIEKLLNIKL